MARQTLDGSLKLIDPVWGGAYRYSTHGDWRHIHFEKIMQVQAEYLRIYARPYRDRPAAFFCAQGRCSLPVFRPGDLEALAARLGQAASPAASPR